MNFTPLWNPWGWGSPKGPKWLFLAENWLHLGLELPKQAG